MRILKRFVLVEKMRVLTMHNYNPIVIIPHYNHSNTLGKVVQTIKAQNLPILIIDDGSAYEHHAVLAELATFPQINVHYCPQNAGKGYAVKKGIRLAFSQGFSHAIQVDADGQHKLDDIQKMLEKSKENPTACICGKPIYGNDAPKARLYGRKITNFWMAINTLSLDLADGMCGFRLYPLIETIRVLDSSPYIGNRMEFDVELLVYLKWAKVPLVWIDTPVQYTQDGISHFRGFADNWRISKMHARLFFSMLKRLITGKGV